jgi:hypothetical protein
MKKLVVEQQDYFKYQFIVLVDVYNKSVPHLGTIFCGGRKL